MNKKQLYESIMRHVAKEVKKALNESFEYEKNSLALDIKQVLKDNVKISSVCAKADENDWKELLTTMKSIAEKGYKEYTNIEIRRIANIRSLAIAILAELDISNIRLLLDADDVFIEDTIECLCEKEDINECGELPLNTLPAKVNNEKKALPVKESYKRK